MNLTSIPALGAPVTDVEVSIRVNSHVGRSSEFTAFIAGPPDLLFELALGGELLNPMIVEVGNIDFAGGIDGDAPRGVKLSFTYAFVAKRANEGTVVLENPDLVAPTVCDIDGSVRCNCDSRRSVGLGIAVLQCAERPD